MEQHPSVSLERHLEAYVGWMRYQQQRLHNGESSVDQATVQHLLKNHDAREQLISQVEDSGVDGYFFMLLHGVYSILVVSLRMVPWTKELPKGLYHAIKEHANSRAILGLRFI